jgi:hypothetical protein
MSAISYLRKYVINILDLRIDQNDVEKFLKHRRLHFDGWKIYKLSEMIFECGFIS